MQNKHMTYLVNIFSYFFYKTMTHLRVIVKERSTQVWREVCSEEMGIFVLACRNDTQHTFREISKLTHQDKLDR